ncbi:cysteine desulfurase [Agaricicola taiwanensis]|uniref:Cysteine desulfurase n=1 Tax=Agaricicola taiwanensis TaxID=591372 RepID=A0A8J2YHW0_9RHOB|nr:cysteine desulfurase family protein [Agaricicola taiwanensis]GGE43869.1 cysteine desulfurase [Agaricicola taiwanensis]
MASPRIYFDHNATALLRPEARVAMIAALDMPGNASAIHAEGRIARGAAERAREAVASLCGAEAKNVTFTSGATEALSLALSPHWQDGAEKPPLDALLISATEHSAALQGHRFPAEAVEVLPVARDGRIELDALDEALARRPGQRIMVALQTANNETGVLQPIGDVAARVHAVGGLMAVDAVQSAGKMTLDIRAMGADLLIVSAHKIGGPSGVGALIRIREALHLTEPMLRGGGQEKGLRAGTANVTGIVGFGAAAEAAAQQIEYEAAQLASFCDRLEIGLKDIAPDFVVFGEGAPRLPNTVAFAVPGISSETALMALDLAGLAVSAGSACSSGKVQISHVLDAMGVDPQLARGLIRISLGWSTTEEEVRHALAILDRELSILRVRAQGRAA